MDELSGGTWRLDAGRRVAREALRAGFQSLPSATVAHLFRRVHRSDRPRARSPKRRHGPRSAVGASFAGYTICGRWAPAGWPRSIWRCIPGCRAACDQSPRGGDQPRIIEFRRKGFNREADLAATLWHPHIVGVHDRGEFDGQLWISMDYVEGTDACPAGQERYRDGMPVDDVCAILTAVAARSTTRTIAGCCTATSNPPISCSPIPMTL